MGSFFTDVVLRLPRLLCITGTLGARMVQSHTCHHFSAPWIRHRFLSKSLGKKSPQVTNNGEEQWKIRISWAFFCAWLMRFLWVKRRSVCEFLGILCIVVLLHVMLGHMTSEYASLILSILSTFRAHSRRSKFPYVDNSQRKIFTHCAQSEVTVLYHRHSVCFVTPGCVEHAIKISLDIGLSGGGWTESERAHNRTVSLCLSCLWKRHFWPQTQMGLHSSKLSRGHKAGRMSSRIKIFFQAFSESKRTKTVLAVNAYSSKLHTSQWHVNCEDSLCATTGCCGLNQWKVLIERWVNSK